MDEFDTHIYDYIENSLKISPGYAMLRNFDKQIWKHSIYNYFNSIDFFFGYFL